VEAGGLVGGSAGLPGPLPLEYVEQQRTGRGSDAMTNARWLPEGIEFWTDASGNFAQAIGVPRSETYLDGFRDEVTISWRQYNRGDTFDRPMWNHGDGAGNGYSCRAPFTTTDPQVMWDWGGHRYASSGHGDLYSGWHSLMVSGANGMGTAPPLAGIGWKDGTTLNLVRTITGITARDAARPFQVGGRWTASTNPTIAWLSHWYAFDRFMDDEGLAAQLHQFPYYFFTEPVRRTISFGSQQAWVVA